jgi:hypothetical protein
VVLVLVGSLLIEKSMTLLRTCPLRREEGQDEQMSKVGVLLLVGGWGN